MADQEKVEEIKAGARNSRMDQSSLNTAHDALVAAGAYCPGVDGEAPKSYRRVETSNVTRTDDKSITDAPNLRGDDWQSCINCQFFKWMPAQEVTTYGEAGPAEGQTEPQGICQKYEFMAQAEFVCDSWQAVPPPAAVPAEVSSAEDIPMAEEKAFTNSLKAISKTDNELRVANYIFLHGGRDLTGVVYGKNEDGSRGEFFSERTNPESEYTKSGFLHVDFEHGFDPDKIGNHKNNVLGYVDWKTARRDKTGLYVERVLNRRHEYMQWLEELIEEGLIGNSSEAIPELVEKAVNGEILRWGLRRDTLTVTPMEPRMLSQNAVTAIKHLAEIAPQLKSILNITDEPTQEPQVMGLGEDKAVLETETDTTKNAGQPLPAKEIEMADNEQVEKTTEVKGFEIDYDKLATMVAEKLDTPAPSKAVPAVIHAENLGDPDPYKALVKWSKGENAKGLGALKSNIKGTNLRISENTITFEWNNTKAIKAALQEDTAGEGGNLVPNDFFPRIIAKRDEGAIARKAGAQVFSTTRDYLDIPTENASMSDFTVVAEEGAVSESEPTFGNAQAHVYNFRRLVKVSEELLEDDGTNLGEFLSDATGRAMALAENNYTLVGTGSSEPQGVYVGGSVGYTFADTNAITAAEIAALYWTLGEPYHEEATWNMRGATMGALQALTGNPFSFLTTPVADTFKNMFYGNKPYYLSDKVAAIATGAKTIMIGNWRFYALVERRQITFSRNPYLYQANGQVGLFWGMRFGGVVLQSEAFKWGIQA